MTVEEVFFGIYAAIFIAFAIWCIYFVVKEFVQANQASQADEDHHPLMLVSSTAGVIYLVVMYISASFLNLVFALGNSFGVGSTLERLALGPLILQQLIPLLIITAWRYGDAVMKKYFQLPPVEMVEEHFSYDSFVSPPTSPAATTKGNHGERGDVLEQDDFKSKGDPLMIKSVHLALWLISIALVLIGFIRVFMSPTLTPIQERGIIFYQQLNEPTWFFVPSLISNLIIFLMGIFTVVWTAKKMRGADTEDQTSFIWFGVWMIVGSTIVILTNALADSQLLQSGAHVIYGFAFLMCEKEKLRLQEDKTFHYLRLEASDSHKNLALRRPPKSRKINS